jgi:hypothetical protein
MWDEQLKGGMLRCSVKSAQYRPSLEFQISGASFFIAPGHDILSECTDSAARVFDYLWNGAFRCNGFMAAERFRLQQKPPWVSIRQAEPNRGHPVLGLHESYTRDVWNRPMQWQPIPALREPYEQPVTSPFHRRAAISHPGRTMFDMQGVARPASAGHRRPVRLSSSPSESRKMDPRALTKEFERIPKSKPMPSTMIERRHSVVDIA